MGHALPTALQDTDDERWVTGRTQEIADDKAKSKFPGGTLTLTRDPDVYDTWFSAGGRLQH